MDITRERFIYLLVSSNELYVGLLKNITELVNDTSITGVKVTDSGRTLVFSNWERYYLIKPFPIITTFTFKDE